jgi:hypothetical protein
MKYFKKKAKSILVPFLVLSFFSLVLHADPGTRSLYALGSGPLCAGHSLSERYLPESKSTRVQTSRITMDEDRIAKACLLGLVGNVIGSCFFVSVGCLLLGDIDETFSSEGVLLAAAAVGSVCGSAFGVYLAGNSRRARGKLDSTMLGSFLGGLAATAITLAAGRVFDRPYVFLLSFAILPPAGSLVFFNSSLRPGPLAAGNGLLNLSGGRLGLGVPDIQVRPLPVYGENMKLGFQFKINLLSVVL